MSLFKKGKGGFNRVLNLIGLEDDDRQPEQPAHCPFWAFRYK